MALPSSLALAGILDRARIIASDHRNNYAAVQTAVNALIAMLQGAFPDDVFGWDAATSTFKPVGVERVYNVKHYGAKGDGSTDDSAAIQSAIDACSAAGGGKVLIPPATYKCNVVLKQGVVLTGVPLVHLPGTTTAAKLGAFATGTVIDTPVGATYAMGVEGLILEGLGLTACRGIRFRNTQRSYIKRVTLDNFADEGVLVESPSVCVTLEDVFAQNCVLNRARAAVIGAVDIGGSDHYISRVEATVSGSREGTVQSVNLYCAAIVMRMANGMVHDCIGESSDSGFHVIGSNNRFTGCRADINYGHGWNIAGGGQNQFAACLGYNNSQDTTNTYDNWFFSSASALSVVVGCVAQSISAKVARYGFNDQVASDTNKNFHIGPQSAGAATAQLNNQTSAGSGWAFAAGTHKQLTNNSATPSVLAYERFFLSNSAPTTITNFTEGVDGQRITVVCVDSNTTIQHNGVTIILIGGGDKKLRNGVTYDFYRGGGIWREVTSRFPLGVTPNVGDAAKILQVSLSEETQVWASPLTAARAITLSTTGAYAGATFRIVRTAASTGAFNLNVGTGPLKALTVGQWCDVTFDGSAWMLSGFGSL